MKAKKPLQKTLDAFEAAKIGDQFGKFTLLAKVDAVWSMQCSCGNIEQHKRREIISKDYRKRCFACVTVYMSARTKPVGNQPHEASTMQPWVYKLAFSTVWVNHDEIIRTAFKKQKIRHVCGRVTNR